MKAITSVIKAYGVFSLVLIFANDILDTVNSFSFAVSIIFTLFFLAPLNTAFLVFCHLTNVSKDIIYKTNLILFETLYVVAVGYILSELRNTFPREWVYQYFQDGNIAQKWYYSDTSFMWYIYVSLFLILLIRKLIIQKKLPYTEEYD